MVNLAKLRYDAMPCLKLIIQCRNNINTVFLVLYIIHAIPYCAEYVEIVSNLRLEEMQLSLRTMLYRGALCCVSLEEFLGQRIFSMVIVPF